MNELSFLQDVASGPTVWRRGQPDFLAAQWLRDALSACGYLRLGTSRRIDDSLEGEESFCVLGLTPAGESHKARIEADRARPLWNRRARTDAHAVHAAAG
ncbi:hypothetical protein [Tahibacter soli]|jgi:hypothetical protein|uniref:Uncharacterized protein n=1 Tax=Tahibacter soli TaxID=2983605 RepID=A0A9X3YL03_9GAMM|nr:hypothetical protein [Tahibacter soli]MDC8012633.1 hypothetical protein [Tahibacter soli]